MTIPGSPIARSSSRRKGDGQLAATSCLTFWFIRGILSSDEWLNTASCIADARGGHTVYWVGLTVGVVRCVWARRSERLAL